MNPFPAVLIGGPPNSGKSVLMTSLSQSLRRRQVQHYVLRACPDGEGDWTQQADQSLVRTILVPRAWTPAFVEHICIDIQHRHLPLLVDVGGRPLPWQESIFDCCTHSILLTPDDTARAHWLEMMARHCVAPLADLHTSLEGEGVLIEEQPVLLGTLVGLRRGAEASGPAFDALLDRLSVLFHYSQADLRKRHLDAAPVEITLQLDRLKDTLDIGGEPDTWEPHSLPKVLDYLPPQVPLGLYGRGPNWLYAALALFAHPAELWQFDPRLGWVQPPDLAIGSPSTKSPLQIKVQPGPEHTRLIFSLPNAYLDYNDAAGLIVPPVPPDRGVVLEGKLPHWLLNGIALAYQNQPWLAVYQPQIKGAIMVYAPDISLLLGDILDIGTS